MSLHLAALRRVTQHNFPLRLLLLFAILPGLLALAFISYFQYRENLQAIEGEMQQITRALSQAVDRDLLSAQQSLQALSTSTALRSKQFPDFYLEAQRFNEFSSIANHIALTDATGQQYINTLKPYGAALGKTRNLDRLQAVFTGGQTTISDLVTGSTSGKQVILLDVPVHGPSAVDFALTMVVGTHGVQKVLTTQSVPDSWTIAVLDRVGTVVARNRDPERFIGQKTVPAMLERLSGPTEGIIETPTLDGRQIVGAYSRSSETGFTVVLGVPLEEIHRRIWQSMLRSALAIGLTVLASLYLTWRLSRRILQSIEGITQAAKAAEMGQLDACLAVQGPEEIMHMEAQFNRMLVARKNAEAALLKTTERLEAAASAGIVGIWDWDVVLDKLAWDRVMFQLYGVAPGSFPGDYAAWLQTVHPDDRPYVEGEIQNALRGTADFAAEFRVVWPDATVRHIKAASRTTFDSSGQPLRMIGVNYDITEQKNVEQMLEKGVAERTRELKIARDAAEAANVAKSAFLANMSHEMRTPLHQIQGMAQLIRRHPLSEQQLDRMDKLERASQNLTALVDTVLDLTRIEAGKFELAEAPFNLADVVNEALSDVRATADARHLSLQSDLAAFPLDVLGDKGYIKMALLNYLGNALRFTERGGIVVRLKLDTAVGENLLVRFEVEDTGPGIAEAELPRLFSIFEQLDNSATRQFGGLGMGLAMTRKIAEIMGGEAGCESTPGQGSTFWFTATLKKG